MTTITQKNITLVATTVVATNYIKPAPFAVVLVTEENKKKLTNKVSIFKGESGYDAIQVGRLDDVDYNTSYHDKNGWLKIGTGITLSVDSEGSLDAYPNGGILNTEKFISVKAKYDERLNNLVPSDLLEMITMFTKVVTVPMATVADVKSALGISGKVAVEATWGIQNDIEDHDFIVMIEGDSYKVDCDKSTGMPEKYILA